MEKIFVSIRVRPLSKVEASKGTPWKLGSNSISLSNSGGALIPGQSYVFDKVFDSESSTLEIYETHTKDIIASAVSGFNGTVFAYGQTSSGKTYTMRGSPCDPGIIPLSIQEIFRNIEAVVDREFLLRVSFMEIYNEEINDLLAPENRKLQVHENNERGIFVAGLREEIVVSPEQVLELLTVGETYRHVGETNMNVYSSRSHSIFRMVIESRDRSHDDPSGPALVQSCDAVRVSVLNLVDLAGSERIAKTGAEGTRLKEGAHINKSLMTLGTVINKLSEGVEKQGGHVPYRDSKLTRILQPALGGNAKTAIICNITPAQVHVDETKGTLFFASRANRVTNCAQVNEIMTDAALLKRQKKEIEELRNKLQDNHSEHWDAEILNLRNALLKTELERERMALELQQEKAAQAERERRLKEQQQKIENLSTMVINSAVDDRDVDKRNKKNNRRETWCPRIPSIERSEQPQDSRIPFPKESPLVKSMISTRRENLPPLPPPFESLMEGEGTMSPLQELNENTFGEEFQSLPSDGSNLDSIFQEPPPVLFCERKRRSSEKSMDDDLSKQLGDLQVQYDDLQLQHALKMQEKMLEMKELKEELAFTQSAVVKARKLVNVNNEVEDKRGRSLDGWESDSNVPQLRAQIRNLEVEKVYMQKELDALKLQASTESCSALSKLKELQQELEQARDDAANARVDLSFALQKISDLERDQELGMDQQTALAAHFNELTLEVETTKSSSQAFYKTAVESTNALRLTLTYLQESVINVKSLKTAAEDQHFGSLQSDLEAIVNEHDSALSALQTVLKERDDFCEVSKIAQADLKSLEEIREINDELEATASDLLAANKHIADVGIEISELQSLLGQRESQLQALEQNIKGLEDGVVGATSKALRGKFEERIAELERELKLVSEEKASIISKGEAMHVTIQVLEGERDALIETSKQAQADIDRLQGKRRQEIKVAQEKLESAFSESFHTKEQLITMRSLLSEKTEEQQALQFKLENLQRESTTSTKVLEESIQTLETQLSQMSTKFDSSRREYEELVAIYEATIREKSEISEACDRSEEEVNRLCRQLDNHVQALAETEKRLESGRVQCSKDEKQLSELHLKLSEQNVDLESLRRKVANLSAEKCAMETCLAGHTPESIVSVLEERSLQLSAAECRLQSSMAELEKVKHESTVLEELRVTLETELAQARAYSATVEETLSEAVSTRESTKEKEIEEKERVMKEKEILLDTTVQLQDRISYLEREGEHYQVESNQMERRMASVTSELDDAGKQLNDVHSLLTENQKERLSLQQTLEEMENHKAGLQKCLSIKDAELASTSADLAEVKTKFEAFQQQHSAESSQLRSDVLGLRKELKAAKAAPGALEKERDGLRKDIEKLRSKLGDVEAKLKSILIEKSKVETEKLNFEREVKQLRQSTALLNKRESIVDKRRESVACGLSKTKQLLSTTEHALQIKNNELEKTAFDLQLLQDNYTKLEADMLETENASVILKTKLTEAESAISVLRDEKGAASSIIEKISQKLEDESEQKRSNVAQLDALRLEHSAMEEKLLAFQVASEKAEAEIKSISVLRDDLARQLTDVHFGFEEEKAAWASQEVLKSAKVEELKLEILNLMEGLEKSQKAQGEIISARNTLQEQLNEAEHTASSASVVYQEQLAKLEHSLQCKEQESNQLRQQVELLSSNVEEQVKLQRKLQEELFAGKEEYDAVKDEFKKLKELLVVSEALTQRERQCSEDLAEEVRQLNRMLQEAEKKCEDLHVRISDSEAAAQRVSDERIQLLEERSVLADRCFVLEGQVSQLEVSFKERSDNESRLLQEIRKLKEELQNNMEVSAQQRISDVSRRAIEMEAASNTDREVARKQMEKLHSQLKMSHAEIESLQTELDDVGMKVKSLYLEVDDMQAALDQSRTEKAMLKQHFGDLTARLSSLEDKNEQLQKRETHLLQVSKVDLLSRTKLQVLLDNTVGRLEVVQSNYNKLLSAKKENDALRVRIQNLRSRCERYEEVLKDAKRKSASPEKQQERDDERAEIMQQNSTLQMRLQKSEENAKARGEEMMKLHEVVLRKEESNTKLEAALQRVQAQMLKRERDLYQKSESQTTTKFEGSAVPSLEFSTPGASTHRQDDVNDADDANVLYSSALASRSKVEQLKLQSQSLMRMYKQPWRIQGSPVGSIDETGDHPPPSATLDSHRENLTAPIPTWKRAVTAGASSKTEYLRPSNCVFSEDKRQASASNTRSVTRAALAPVNTHNKLQGFGLKRRLQESGTQDTLPGQGIDEAEIKPSVSSSQLPRNFRFRQRSEKENL